MIGLVLSLFPGIGLLDMAFEEEGFCVVRGPDLLWGGDVRRFHPPAGKFAGVIGGPPCQAFSSLRRLNAHLGATEKFGNLIPEFERCVSEAAPAWFLMENVPEAPEPRVPGYYHKRHMVVDAHVGGETSRKRAFSFGRPQEDCRLWIEWSALHVPDPERAVTGNARVLTVEARIRSRQRGGGTLPGSGRMLPVELMAVLQGLSADVFEHAPFTERAKRQMIGNGVPLPMGRAIARAVKRALTQEPTR